MQAVGPSSRPSDIALVPMIGLHASLLDGKLHWWHGWVDGLAMKEVR